MIDGILDVVTERINGGGLSAFREFPSGWSEIEDVCVCVGAGEFRVLGSGMGSYLGTQEKESGEITELFGKRLELEIVFEVFSPFKEEFGAEGALRGADRLRAIIPDFPSGIRPLEFSCDAAKPDEELSAFRCLCRLKCFAFLVAEDEEDTGEFLDFVLKGVVDGVN